MLLINNLNLLPDHQSSKLMAEQALENITKYLESLNLRETADALRKEQGEFLLPFLLAHSNI